MSEWQPIETAPKDGTRLLIYSPENVAVAHWEEWEQLDYGGWLILEKETSHGIIECSCIYYATHWMPLPKPPQAS